MTTTHQYLPCPFCGRSDLRLEARMGGLFAHIHCSCGARGPSVTPRAWAHSVPPDQDARETTARAVAAWNGRKETWQ